MKDYNQGGTNDSAKFSGQDLPDELRKDLGFKANQKKEALRLAKAEAALAEKLKRIKTRFKTDNVKVAIKPKGKSLVLTATLPLKPNTDGSDASEGGVKTKQYDLSLGIPYSLDGLEEAELEGRSLGKLIATKTFTWNEKYLGKGFRQSQSPEQMTVNNALLLFEKRYFETRVRNRQSEGTFAQYLVILKSLLKDFTFFESKKIKEIILTLPVGSAKRRNAVLTSKLICNILQITIDLKNLANGYKPKSKKVPNDKEIIQCFQNIVSLKKFENKNAKWAWTYGMLATYGLRIHELWAIDIEKFLDPNNIKNIIYIDETLTNGTKTGSRYVFPLHPEWVEKFDLKNIKFPDLNGDLQHKSNQTCRIFREKKISFTPHTLRHAYAIRGHRLGIPLKTMADNMGHSIEMHTKTYLEYISLESRTEIMQKALDTHKGKLQEQSELELLKAENATLKAENEALRMELRLLKEIHKC